MISATDVSLVSTLGYAIAVLIAVGLTIRLPASKRRYFYPIVGLLGVAVITTGLSWLGVGTLPIAGGELDLARVLDDLIAYPILWTVAGLLADVPRRTLGSIGVVAGIQVIAFNVASVLGGVIGLLGLIVVVAGYGILLYLFLGPVWKHAETVPDEQRLLHWKARNLLLFLIGMLIVFSLLTVTTLLDAFVTTALSEYVGLLIRVGFAGFLFANSDAVVPGELRSLGTGDHVDGSGS